MRDTSPIVKLSFAGIVLTGHFSLGSAKQQELSCLCYGRLGVEVPHVSNKKIVIACLQL